MIPPTFTDLGSKARDLFTRNFKPGFISLDYLSKSGKNIDLSLKGEHDIKGGKLSGSVESNYRFSDYIKSTVKWDTRNTLYSTVSMENTVAKGTKHSGTVSFQPDTGMKTFKTKSSYKRKYLNLGLDLEFLTNIKPIVTSSIVIGCTEDKGYLAGAEVTYNSDRMTLLKHKFALGYQIADLSLLATVVNKSDVECLVYQKVNNEVELAVNVKWNCNSRDTDFGIATKYNFHKDAFVKAKINNNSLVGLVYGFKARDDVDVSLSAQIDVKDLEKGSHKFGVGLSYSP